MNNKDIRKIIIDMMSKTDLDYEDSFEIILTAFSKLRTDTKNVKEIPNLVKERIMFGLKMVKEDVENLEKKIKL